MPEPKTPEPVRIQLPDPQAKILVETSNAAQQAQAAANLVLATILAGHNVRGQVTGYDPGTRTLTVQTAEDADGGG